MLSQRILARRVPQVATRYAIAPRATFSQVSALRAAEVEDPLQVRCPPSNRGRPRGRATIIS